MKKVLGIIVIAGSFVACNNSSETTPAADSPAVHVDSPAVVTPVIVDTPVVKVDSPAVSTDTTKK